jgi:hypothetical protein
MTPPFPSGNPTPSTVDYVTRTDSPPARPRAVPPTEHPQQVERRKCLTHLALLFATLYFLAGFFRFARISADVADPKPAGFAQFDLFTAQATWVICLIIWCM